MIQKYKRSLIIIGLLLCALIGGVMMMALDLEITGSLFLLGGTCLVIYLFSFWFLQKKNILTNSHSWLAKETWIASISVGLIALSGAFESSSSYPELTVVYILILIIAGRIGYFDFRNNERKIPLWLLGISLGIVFIALNDFCLLYTSPSPRDRG